MCDRTSHIALWTQGCVLSAAPQAKNLYKVATAITEAGKRRFGTFALFKSTSQPSLTRNLYKVATATSEAGKSVLGTFALFKSTSARGTPRIKARMPRKSNKLSSKKKKTKLGAEGETRDINVIC